ncbi:hypothetical protein Btru_025766 [Bulinus truncatus]|nr:hypothetical protein Btru_025766 [Bulinus truncatus]
MSDIQTESIKLPDHTQPSDYSDVQPKTYDPEFISQISSKMQVPDRISVGSEYDTRDIKPSDFADVSSFVRMTVPDRIVLAGDNQHIGLRQDLDLDLPADGHKISDMSYVGLITPPRILTLEERFPIVEVTDEKKLIEAQVGSTKQSIIANGHVVGPVPYDPGVSLNESVLLNEENEATLLRTQVAKLTRRVQVIEQDNQRRASRELVMYPLILGYFLWKLLGWFTRDR